MAKKLGLVPPGVYTAKVDKAKASKDGRRLNLSFTDAELMADKNPLHVQVGGAHYKGKRIQPVEYIAANNLGFLEGCIVKRITRWREKNGIEDLEKIKHEVDLLIEMEKRYPQEG